MLRSLPIFLALLAAGTVDGAALVRVINTVPTRTEQIAATTGGANKGYVTVFQSNVDRVGLQYVPTDSTGAATVGASFVWTEPLSNLVTTESAAANGGAYTHAMPPLRGCHVNGATTAMKDSITLYKSSDINTAVGATAYPAEWDAYSQDLLKADGLSGYLSFAAGTYRFQPYAIFGDGTVATVYTNTARTYTAGIKTVVFEDNKVYTLVITGDGKWSVTTPSVAFGADFIINVLEESTAPTTFGMAALRWFHGAKSFRTETLAVYNGDTTNAPQLAAGIAFGGVSAYIDVAPKAAAVFPVVSSSGPIPVAPSTSNKFEVTHDVRAGLRATVICAVHSEDTGRVFCRMVPSRVVAYVRLVNDLGGYTSFGQGAGGALPFNKIKLDLFASSELPRADQAYETSQSFGVKSAVNHVLNVRGFYKVLSGVSAGACSGYSEVFVPLAIMDFAIRWTVIRDSLNAHAAADAVSGITFALINTVTPTVSLNTAAGVAWFLGGAYHKKVNFAVRTEGGALISGAIAAGGALNYRFFDAANRWLTVGAVSNDVFVEAGSYYTLAVTPSAPVVGTDSLGVTNPVPRFLAILGHLDRSVDDVSNGIPSGNAYVKIAHLRSRVNTANAAVVATNSQNFGAKVINMRPKNGGSASTYTFAAWHASNAFAGEVRDLSARDGGETTDNNLWTASYIQNHFNLVAGTYTLDVTGSTSCVDSLPSTDVTLKAGDLAVAYVLNVYGCLMNSNDQAQLKTVICSLQSAVASGNDANTLLNPGVSTPAPAAPFFFAAAPAVSVSVSMVVALLFAVVAALF